MTKIIDETAKMGNVTSAAVGRRWRRRLRPGVRVLDRQQDLLAILDLIHQARHKLVFNGIMRGLEHARHQVTQRPLREFIILIDVGHS